MRRIGSTVVVLLVCIVMTTSVAVSGENSSLLRAGTAKVDITPQKPVRMSGYAGRKGLSQGVHDQLSARVIVFDNSRKKLVLVSTDLIGFYSGTSEHIGKVLLK